MLCGFAAFVRALFVCRHKKISRVFNTGSGNYVCCLDGCGKRFSYDWHTMTVGKEL